MPRRSTLQYGDHRLCRTGPMHPDTTSNFSHQVSQPSRTATLPFQVVSLAQHANKSISSLKSVEAMSCSLRFRGILVVSLFFSSTFLLNNGA